MLVFTSEQTDCSHSTFASYHCTFCVSQHTKTFVRTDRQKESYFAEGRSHVLTVASTEAVINHRPSDENACTQYSH